AIIGAADPRPHRSHDCDASRCDGASAGSNASARRDATVSATHGNVTARSAHGGTAPLPNGGSTPAGTAHGRTAASCQSGGEIASLMLSYLIIISARRSRVSWYFH